MPSEVNIKRQMIIWDSNVFKLNSWRWTDWKLNGKSYINICKFKETMKKKPVQFVVYTACKQKTGWLHTTKYTRSHQLNWMLSQTATDTNTHTRRVCTIALVDVVLLCLWLKFNDKGCKQREWNKIAVEQYFKQIFNKLHIVNTRSRITHLLRALNKRQKKRNKFKSYAQYYSWFWALNALKLFVKTVDFQFLLIFRVHLIIFRFGRSI